jgi:hypothetical protein
MLDAAFKKAVEAGLLPRHACREDTKGYQELIRYVVQAALEASPSSPSTAGQRCANTRRGTIRDRFLEVHEIAHWMHGYAQN